LLKNENGFKRMSRFYKTQSPDRLTAIKSEIKYRNLKITNRSFLLNIHKIDSFENTGYSLETIKYSSVNSAGKIFSARSGCSKIPLR